MKTSVQTIKATPLVRAKASLQNGDMTLKSFIARIAAVIPWSSIFGRRLLIIIVIYVFAGFLACQAHCGCHPC